MTRRMVLGIALAVAGLPMIVREAAADAPPYVTGYYVPMELAASCRERSFEVFDWVLAFSSKGMGDSEGVCTFKGWKALEPSAYRIQMRCNSQGEVSNQTMTIKTKTKGGQITTIDGKPYAFCGPLKRK